MDISPMPNLLLHIYISLYYSYLISYYNMSLCLFMVYDYYLEQFNMLLVYDYCLEHESIAHKLTGAI